MKLFNKKTLSRHLEIGPIPDAHLELVQKWSELITSGQVHTLKETALHGPFSNVLLEGVLGYAGAAQGAQYTVSAEQQVLAGSVDLALGHFGADQPRIIAPLELKGAKTRDLDAIMPGRNKSPVQQAWEYAMNAPGVRWVMVSNMTELRLYGFGEGTEAFETFDLARLTDPVEYARFTLLLSAENLLSGRTATLLEESRREDKDITDSLYRDYRDLRNLLVGAVRTAAPDTDPLDAIARAQTILDRVLFVAFAEDTGLLDDNTLQAAFEHVDPYNPRPIWDNFVGLFRAIDQGRRERRDDAGKTLISAIPPYNGGLFKHDPAIDALTLPDDICRRFARLSEYDFASEVSVTVLGHVFEQSIADVEALQAAARGEDTTDNRRKRDGVVYTPDYIARFIVAQTLGAHIGEAYRTIFAAHARKDSPLEPYQAIRWRRKSAELEAWRAYRDRLQSLRIVDPACGSGVFLVMAFDFMKAEMTRVNDKIAELQGGAASLFDPDSEVLTNNLFGVDVNAESVEITKLSLWIKTARRGKVLDSLDGNIRVGDSLIEDSNFAYLDHGFTWETAFPDIFAEGGFDVVLGNPPYVRMELLKALKPYLERRYEVVSDRADLYCYFYERGLKLLKPGGRLGYISSNTFFKTGSGKPLRDYLLREATLESVVDFGDLQVFEGVTTYPAILTMQRGAAPQGQELQFWKVDTLPEANFRATYAAARGPFPQAALGSGSWELENPALRALREKIRAGKPTLKEVYGAPLYGIKTGLNAAFVIDTATKERLCAEDPKSAELLKPFLEGKDLKRWRAEPRGLWLILIPKGWTTAHYTFQDEASAWAQFAADHPGLAKVLEPFSSSARKRTDQGDFWWELRACSYYSAFELPKIIYSRFADRTAFSFDSAGLFFNDAPYFIASAEKELCAYLNSRCSWFQLTQHATALRGGFVQLLARYIEPLAIPLFTSVAREKLSARVDTIQTAAQTRLTLQTAFTRRIPDLCPPEREPKLTTRLKSWWTLPDFAAFRAEVKKAFKADIPLSERSDWEDWMSRDRAEIARLTAEITAIEAQIDAIVYDLFDLTPDEIALLEASI
ncbi:Eco57I restriction-modification methylase domain-containing protein [Pseudaestuariivita sp.]|uniref:Eco57I restriction-modification methylase domain-containing protein n=1 Tax=Pseudaestuariivita sp. TaxID=2211669 RepID=UPI0040583443